MFISILKAKLSTIDLDPLKSEDYNATPNSEGSGNCSQKIFLFVCFSKIKKQQQRIFDKTGEERRARNIDGKTNAYGGHVSNDTCEV